MAAPANSYQVMIVGEDGTTVLDRATRTHKATITRPANTNAYAQYDIVAAEASGASVVFQTFTAIGRVVNGSGYITKARLETNRTTEAGLYRLYIFRKTAATLTSPLTNLGDNDLFVMKIAHADDCIGYVDFNSWVTGGSGSDAAMSVLSDVRLAFGCATADSNLYGLLVTNAAVTPASGQIFNVYLTAEQN